MSVEKWAELDLGQKQPEIEIEVETSATPEVETKVETPEAEGIKNPKINERIKKLVNQRREKEVEVARLQAELEAERASKAQVAKDQVKTYGSNVDLFSKNLEQNLDLLKKSYKDAYEKGDSDALADVNDKIIAARTQLEQLKSHRQQVAQTERQLDAAPPPEKTARQEAPKNEAMDDWIADNDWFTKDARQRRRAIMHNDDLVDEGFDPSSQEFYAELDKRLQSEKSPAKAPAKEETVEEVDLTPIAKGSPTGASSRGAPTSGNKVRLSQQDVAYAKKMGIPLQEYAREMQKIAKAQKAGSQYMDIFE